MEWTVPVNDMLQEDITKLNHTLIPPGFNGDVRSVRVMQESLSKLIDALGEQSAAAQGLNKVITTSEKLRNTPDHILYLLKDSRAQGGRGEVVGLLKMGRKHLFLFDEHAQVREVEPLCVLDFFVQRDRQRRGLGRLLFDHMLQDMGTSAAQLAVDGPSPKMEQFLRKNYGVERLVRQSNNFAVAPQFFETSAGIRSTGRTTPVTPVAVGRFAAAQPHSAIATVIHGGTGASSRAGAGGGYYRGSSNGSASGTATPEAEPEPEAPPAPAAEPPAEPEPARRSPERPATLPVTPAVAATTERAAAGTRTPAPMPSPAGSSLSRRDSQLTERGYFDVKFYHNKLW